MQVLPALRQQALVGHVVGDGVFEDVLPLGEEACLVNQLGMRQGIQVVLDLRRHFRDACEPAKAELASNDGRGLDRPLDRLLQPIDPSANDVLDGRGCSLRRAGGWLR